MGITREQAACFERDGFAYVGPVLNGDELAAAREAYDRIIEGEQKPASFRELGLKEGETAARLSVMQVIDMWRLDPVFQEIVSKPLLLDIAEALMGVSNIRLYHDQALYKPPFHGGAVPWHQDNGYWALDPAAAVSCWIAFDDVDQENGCMWVIPGSHRGITAAHGQAGKSVQLKTIAVDDSAAVPLPMPAGCGMFHHCQTLHRTNPNFSPRRRRAFAIHYMPAGVKQNGAYLPDTLLLRGEGLV